MSGTALATGSFGLDVAPKNRWLAPGRSQTESPTGVADIASASKHWRLYETLRSKPDCWAGQSGINSSKLREIKTAPFRD